MANKSPIFLALDGLSARDAVKLMASTASLIRLPKIHDLLDANGPDIILSLNEAGAQGSWVDYKLHDTKDTVALRVKALVGNGAKIITVHASGGVQMMRAAVEAARANAEIWAITVLTSLGAGEIARIYGKERTVFQIVLEFARMAKEAGVNTIVCSVKEVGMLASHSDLQGMQFAVPGTRSAGADFGQQKRSGTPAQAIADGATYLVVGTQVTKAADPIKALEAFAVEIGRDI